MADTKYFAVVTDLGTKEMLEAVNEERKVNITHFAVGDGGGEFCTPDVTMTGLKNEVWRGEIGSCRISDESENVMIVETVIPSNEGGFTIREMAVFDDKGTMIAVCNTPDTAKVRITDGVVHELRLQMEILLNNKESAQLLVDPYIITATKQELMELDAKVEELKNHIYKPEWSIATEPTVKQIAEDCLKGITGTIILPESSRIATDGEVEAVKEKVMEAFDE